MFVGSTFRFVVRLGGNCACAAPDATALTSATVATAIHRRIETSGRRSHWPHSRAMPNGGTGGTPAIEFCDEPRSDRFISALPYSMLGQRTCRFPEQRLRMSAHDVV